MGFDLLNKNNKGFHANMFAWGLLLDVAQEHGWEPMGTEPSDRYKTSGYEWDKRNYGTNDRQIVSAEDANNWADALEKARPLFGERAKMFEEFIIFCREGSFTIG